MPIDKPETFLTPAQLCERWRGAVTLKTLANWRSSKDQRHGPPYVKIGGRILYRLDDVEAYEKRMHGKNSRPLTPPTSAAPKNSRRRLGSARGRRAPPSDMTAQEFKMLGEFICGPRWHKPLAREIGKSSKQVRNYAREHTPIPQPVAEKVRRLGHLGKEGEIIKAEVLRHLPRSRPDVVHLIAREAADQIRGNRR